MRRIIPIFAVAGADRLGGGPEADHQGLDRLRRRLRDGHR